MDDDDSSMSISPYSNPCDDIEVGEFATPKQPSPIPYSPTQPEEGQIVTEEEDDENELFELLLRQKLIKSLLDKKQPSPKDEIIPLAETKKKSPSREPEPPKKHEPSVPVNSSVMESGGRLVINLDDEDEEEPPGLSNFLYQARNQSRSPSISSPGLPKNEEKRLDTELEDLRNRKLLSEKEATFTMLRHSVNQKRKKIDDLSKNLPKKKIQALQAQTHALKMKELYEASMKVLNETKAQLTNSETAIQSTTKEMEEEEVQLRRTEQECILLGHKLEGLSYIRPSIRALSLTRTIVNNTSAKSSRHVLFNKTNSKFKVDNTTKSSAKLLMTKPVFKSSKSPSASKLLTPKKSPKRKSPPSTPRSCLLSQLSSFKCLRLSSQFDKLSPSANPISDDLSNKINPFKIMCYFDLNGHCMDTKCQMQHDRDYRMNTREKLLDLVKYDVSVAGLTPEDPKDVVDKKIGDFVDRLVQVKSESSSAELACLVLKMIRQSAKSNGQKNPMDACLGKDVDWRPLMESFEMPKDFKYSFIGEGNLKKDDLKERKDKKRKKR